MSLRRQRPTRTYAMLLTVGLCTGGAAALASMSVNAQSTVQENPAPSPTVSLESIGNSLTNMLSGTQASPTEVSLTSSIEPSTPWPMPSNISQTLLTTSHDLLAYAGIDATARKMLGADYAIWHSQFANKSEAKALPQSGLLMTNGCLQPKCNVQKSLLIVDPTAKKIYAAMVTEGKVAMWPSLMGWPDEAVPSLKDWLSDATE